MPNSAPVYCQPNPPSPHLVRRVGARARSLLFVVPLSTTPQWSRPLSHDPPGMRTHGPPPLQYQSAREISPSRVQSSRLGHRTTTPLRNSPRSLRILALVCIARPWRTILLWRLDALTDQIPSPLSLGVPSGPPRNCPNPIHILLPLLGSLPLAPASQPTKRLAITDIPIFTLAPCHQPFFFRFSSLAMTL